MKTINILLLSLFAVSCNKTTVIYKTEKLPVFKNPIINQVKTDGAVCHFEDAVNHCYPDFVAKYKFSDSIISFSNSRGERRKWYEKDFMDERIIRRSDSIQTDGFEIVPDYSKSIDQSIFYDPDHHFLYYPVYILNQTPTSKAFVGKDGHVFGIQEALDTNGYWRPIEGRGFDFCGNGYWGLKVHPREFLMVLFPKYSGTYKTKLRVRIENAGNVFISKPYDGTINERQFYIKKDDYFYRHLSENKVRTIQSIFYGAIPLGAEEKDFSLYATWTN